MTTNHRGFTLLEVMISVLIFSMISVLIFSILDRSVLFTAKGEEQVRELEQHYNLTLLVRRQVQGAWIDPATKSPRLNQLSDQQFSIITTGSIMYPVASLVIAFYEFDPDTGTLYYTERRDFYNPEYTDHFPPQEGMIPLLVTDKPLQLHSEEESNLVTLVLAGKEYRFHPMCSKPLEEDNHG